MRINKYKILPLLISLILFIIPFFWLKPGEMDLGGDSSRLYFYDPLNYLRSVALYGVDPSGTGSESISYYLIPFVSLLIFLKKILGSSYLLITLVNSLSLAIAFFSVYWIVVTFLIQDHDGDSRSDVHFAGIVSGLFYILSPILTPNGWDKALVVHNLIFLNPLLFLLLLKYILSKIRLYLFAALLITFIFAANFSPSPYFFSFYPLAAAFLLLYAWKVKRIALSSKEIVVSGLLLVFLHSFHLFPLLMNLLHEGSSLFGSTFTDVGKFSRGLDYFLSVAKTTKVTYNLLSIPQGEAGILRGLEWLWIVFPAVLIIGLILGKKTGRLTRSVLLLFIFFFITLFFATAKITDVGFYFYKSLFYIPGFAMFRNYVGQFSWVFIFFYSLLLGYLLFYILSYFNRKGKITIFLCLTGIIVVNAWPFIRGDMINLVLNKDSETPVSSPIVMDQSYEQTLRDIRNDPIDAKYLSLPLTDPGWQILAGAKGGAYQGPPIISYLAGKRDFSGYDILSPFSEYFLKIAKQEDYPSLDNLLTFLNIRYIFYNSDPSIYDDTFPDFPYGHVRDFLPKDQKSYQQFLEHFAIKKKKDFGDKYHLYSVKDHLYLPHLYIAIKVQYWNDVPIDPSVAFSFIEKDKRVAVYAQQDIIGEHFFEARNKSQYIEFLKNRKPSKFPSPHISKELSWPIYPLVVWREKEDLKSYKIVSDEFIDRSIFYAEKRINELEKWSNVILTLRTAESFGNLNKSWKEPTLFEFQRFDEYNTWEISLLRYMRQMLDLISKIEEAKSVHSVITNKAALNRILTTHEQKIEGIIKESKIKRETDRKYLLKLVDGMFDDILLRLSLEIPQFSTIAYHADDTLASGKYEVYVEKEEIEDFDRESISLAVSDRKLYPQLSAIGGKWIRFDDLSVSNDDPQAIEFFVDSQNLIAKTQWRPIERVAEREDSTIFTVESESTETIHGLTREILQWSHDSLYLISFDYITNGREFEIEAYESGKKRSSFIRVASDLLRSKEWKSFRALAPSGEETDKAFLRIKKVGEDALEASIYEGQPIKIEIRNLSVRKIPRPRIVLKKASDDGGRDIPKITFTKVNPTKYTIKIEGVNKPYTLVFLDRFSLRWKLFLTDERHKAKGVRGTTARLVGAIGKAIVGKFIQEDESAYNNQVVASYFSGDVVEGKHRNIFLGPNTFQTWGINPIAEGKHFMVNGYANAWQVEPKDTGGATDYTLILEMTTQKSFYGMFGIALLTVIMIAINLIAVVIIKSFKRVY